MSVWQFSAALEGWAKANDPNAGKKMSDAEQDDLWEMIEGQS